MILALTLTALLVIVAVVLHLFMLETLQKLLPRLRSPFRVRLGVLILTAIVGHLLEIGVFALGISWLAASGEHGQLLGELREPGFRESYYYSAVTYTSLGFGDLTPSGNLRLLAAVEALTGLVLITWTASYTFLVMQQFYGQKNR